jgi:hypothetical protein
VGTITLSTSKARSIPATGVAELLRRWSARFVIELLVMLIIFQEIMNKNIEHRLDTLLKSDKPMVITGSFNDITELTEQQIKHFKTAEYLWHLHPHNKEDKYKGMHMGVLLDESLNYVHMVFGSIDFVNQISDGKRLI